MNNESLTPKEIEIVKLICKGKLLKEIAYDLKIKLSTLNTHLKNIYHKTHCSNLRELLLWGLRNGIAVTTQYFKP